MARTRAMQNKAIRQDALREWLSKKCTAQHLVDNLEKIESLDTSSETFNNELNKYKEANSQRIKILNYYLPILKQTELKAELGIKEVKNFSDMYD